MLTFQILDGGSTFYRDLEGGSLTIGCDRNADIRLTEAGVATVHARIEPIQRPAGQAGFKIVDLDTGRGTFVNGESIVQARLQLGDRVEIGRAVLVLGKRVRRQATPKDVLRDTVSAPHRRRRGARRPPARTWIGLAAAAAVALTGAVWWVATEDTPPAALEQQAQLRQRGDFDRAQRILTDLRRWAGADPRRRATLDRADARLAATRQATHELRDRLTREVETHSYAQHVRFCRELAAGDSPQSEAAAIVFSDLSGLRMAAADALRAARTREPARLAQSAPTTEPSQLEEPSTEDSLDAALATVERLSAEREHAHALAILRQALASSNAADGVRLRQRLDEQIARAQAEARQLVAEAAGIAGGGRHDEALDFLRGHVARFDGAAELAAVGRAIDRLERAQQQRLVLAAAAGRRRPPPQPHLAPPTAAVVDLLATSRAAERGGDFRAAAAALHDAARAASGDNPELAHRLAGRAEDLGHLAALDALAAKLPGDRRIEVTLQDGAVGRLVVARDAFEVETSRGPRRLSWADMAPAAVRDLVEQLDGDPPAWLGAAVVGFRNGEDRLAESCLIRAVKADATIEPAAWGVLRRGLPPGDPKGYALVAGRFVGLQEIEIRETSRRLERRLVATLRDDAEASRALVEETLSSGPQATEALLRALARQQTRLAKKLDDHSFRRRYDKLTGLRLELDAAREHAKALIHDRERYLYPYQQPAVSAERAAQYRPVQREVDQRVATLRKLWETSASVAVPAAVRQDAARFARVTALLREFGESDTEVQREVAWAFTLPDAGPLDLQNFCRTPAERRDADDAARIEAFNTDVAGPQLTEAERRLVAATNGYRRMFGHRPLAVNLKIVQAARSHCEEMERLGFFGHFSPTAGRRTPFDRMRLAGYGRGASENCARNGSALGAHNAWLGSAGHHRNLLLANHSEFGVGNVAQLWTQNFGSGTEFRTHPGFPAAAPANRDGK